MKTIMKTMKKGLVLAGLAAFCAAAQAADIYEIRPCRPSTSGTTAFVQADPYATIDAPLSAGRDLYFVMRLVRHDVSSPHWRLVHNDTTWGSPTLDEVMYPLQVGLFVSGELRWADLVETQYTTADPVNGGYYYTDFIFKYTTKPGDFALPIKLAVEDEYGNYVPANEAGSASQYVFNRLSTANGDTGKWQIRDKDNVTGVANDGNFAELVLATTVNPLLNHRPWGTRETDFTLKKCGFYVKTVDFHPEWEVAPEDPDPGVWRTVHEASTKVGYGSAQIVADSAVDSAITLYVWSTDESAVKINGGFTATVVTNKTFDSVNNVTVNQSMQVQMARVTIVGGDVYGAFKLYGVSYPKTATLVLSPYMDFTYDANNDRVIDYIEVPVACSEKEAASVYVEINPTEVTADGDLENAKSVVAVYLNQEVDVPLHVTLTPTFNATNGVPVDPEIKWEDYFRFASDESVAATPTKEESETALTIEIPANSTTRQYVYIYPLRSDDYTRTKAKPIRLTPTLADGEQDASGIRNLYAAGFTIKAAKPVVTGIEHEDSVESGVSLSLEISLSDIFADITDETTGYTVKINGTTLPDKYIYKNEKLVSINDSTSLPTVTYNSSGDKTGTIQVLSPYGRQWSEIYTFNVNVRDVTTVVVRTIDGKDDKYNEGDDINFQVGFFSGEDQVKLGQTAYAFLYSDDEIDLGTFDENFIITNLDVVAEGSSGIKINKDVVDWTSASMMALDGANAAKNGAKYRFSVVLCTSKKFDPANVITGYPTSQELNFRVYNVEPVMNGIYVNDSADAYEDGSTYPTKVPVGQTRRFRPDVDDPGQFDLESTADPFKVQWTVYLDGEQYEDDPFIVEGNPTVTNLYYTFTQAGVYTFKCKVKDKDMTKYSSEACSISVIVLDQPFVKVTGKDEENPEETTLGEKSLADGRFTIGLDYFDNRYNGDIRVKLEVVQYANGNRPNPGRLVLDQTYASADPAEPGVYYVTLNKNRKTVTVNAIELDGTDNSQIFGFEIKASVVNADVLPTPNKPANEYYLESSHRVYILNEPPVCSVTPEENTNVWEVAGGAATAHPISWKVMSDVIDDFTNRWADGGTAVDGILVKFDGPANAFTTNLTAAGGGTFIPNFAGLSDEVPVTLTISDKDGATLSWTWQFKVSPSKYLVTQSTGPSGGTTTSRLSQKYVLAAKGKGIGEGHTYVSGSGVTFAGAENFSLRWNCSKLIYMNIYAFGYKVGAVDDGLLDSERDVAIDEHGDRGDPTVAPATPYSYGDAEKDSFFYCWLVTEQGESANSANISVLNNTILPERPGRIGTGRVQLPTETTPDGSYIDTHVEAIFAKEWRPADNLGDINQDGIPDVFAHTTWGSGSTLLAACGYDEIEQDLVDLAGLNPDEDYLPGIYGANGTLANVNDDGASYAPIGLPFTNRREIRGLGLGLNALDLTTSLPDFSTVESNAYYVADGHTLAEVNEQRGKQANEREAWYDIPDDALSTWSPEPRNSSIARLDPTMEDTDSDNFPDGWEYFFWYSAHVLVPGGGYKLQEGQSYPFERFWPERLITGREIPLADVETMFHPLRARTGDEAKKEFDFDDDGLSDLEELIIGTNPAHWDTDGDHMCDGWEVMMALDPLKGGDRWANEDGDFMAYDYHGGVLAWYDETTGRLYFDANNQLKQVIDYDITEVYDDEGNFISNIYTSVNREIQLSGAVVSLSVNWGDGPEPLYYGREHRMDMTRAENVYGAALCRVGSTTCTIPPRSSLYMGKFCYIHDQVRQVYGFDPRTGWYKNAAGLLNARWTPQGEFDSAGVAVNTKAYNAYDEYLLARYRYHFNVSYPSDDGMPSIDNGTWGWLRNMTSNPSVLVETTGEGETAAAGDAATGDGATNTTATASNSAAMTIAENLAEAFALAGSGHAVVRSHGADSDGDGVPDGWELYMRRSPNTAAGEEEDPPPLGRNLMLIIPRDLEDDGLTYAAEFAGLDTCAAYSHCESIYKNHPANDGSPIHNWFNKFFPTNPDEADTDRDAIADGLEGQDLLDEGITFIYGTPSDDGSRCIRGGGLNPLTVDTDQDGLPDAWERQYIGEVRTVADVAADADAVAVADGLLGDRDTTYAGEYIVGGMDGTWPGDVYTDPYDPPPADPPSHSYDPLLGTVRDVDFDHDGLENYQEYLIQTVRHFRWDDITTPLMGRVLYESKMLPLVPHTQGFLCFTPMMHSASSFAATAAYNAYGPEGVKVEVVTNAISIVTNQLTSVVITNYITTVTSNVSSLATAVLNRMNDGGSYSQPWNQMGWQFCGYMSSPEQSWDRSYTDVVLSNPMILLPPMFSAMFSTSDLRPYAPYVSTDPRAWDTDGDGMDDYYEMFHGLNPLLGSADIISDAYGIGENFSAAFNEWTHVDYDRTAAFMGDIPSIQRMIPIGAPLIYDTMMYPWFAGTPGADPDGDGINNFEEMLRANLTSPAPTHTDPTPAWFTDPGLAMSFVSQYYINTPPVRNPMFPESELPFKVQAFASSDLYYDNAVKGSMREDAGDPAPEYGWTFEENEGYDTDNDWVADGREIIKTVKVATDPLDFSDPGRRQAAWFDGNDSFMMTKMQAYRGSDANDLLKQFTVEAWVRPEKRGVEQTILDRCSLYQGNFAQNAAAVIRSNFRLGLDGQGRVYGLFDNADARESGSNEPVSCQRVTGPQLDLGKWAHVAMTYTGKKLTLYVNGNIVDSAATTLIPANGVVFVEQDVGAPTLYGMYEFMPTTFYIGARPIHTPDPADRAMPLTINDIEYGLMREFYQGYVDEVRVWDGARTSAEILENYQKRMTMADARSNRIDVYQVWVNRGTRNDNDGLPMLPTELLMHYDFSTLPGAVLPGDVAKTPSGFDRAVKKNIAVNYETDMQDLDDVGTYSVAYPSRPALVSVAHNLRGGAYGTYDLGAGQDLTSSWWGECATRSKVYDDYTIVPWVENTVAHLAPMDASTFDSFYYAEKLGGSYTPASDANVASFIFPNAANPYPYYTYYLDRYMKLFRRNRLFEQKGEEFEPLLNLYRYEVRSRLVGPSDLLPMGSAYAKRCEEMWDGFPADAWEYTAIDENANGISDWWEAYARANYGGIEWDQDVDWNTPIVYFGCEVPAYQAFLIDLARGLQPNGLVDSAFVSTADVNGNNLPDWWEDLFGVTGGADDDPDNDGLSNYAEYLISFGAAPYGIENGFPLLDPTKARTGKDQLVTDYFLPGPDHDIDENARHISANSYLGQIVSDCDFIENWWEKKYNNSFSSMAKYDPDYDKDEDGWSNWAEARGFMWRGSFVADLIDRYLDNNNHVNSYPEPAIGLKVTYHGSQNVSGKGLVVRTFTGNSPRVDATFTVQGAGDAAIVDRTKILGGYYAGNVVRGNLGPGGVLPLTVHFLMARMGSNGTYYWYDPREGHVADPSTIQYNTYSPDWGYGSYDEYRNALTTNPYFVLDNVAIQFIPFADTMSDAEGCFGRIVYVGTNNTVAVSADVGSINYRTGEYALDLGALARASGMDLDDYLFQAEWQYRPGNEYPQTFWLSEADTGRVKEGKNTIEVFIDMDGDGVYTPGVDPYGALQDVEIGWHRTRELVVELKDESPAIARTVVAAAAAAGAEGGEGAGGDAGSALVTKAVLRRTSINGLTSYNNKTVPVRTLVTKTFVNDDRAYMTEADALSAVAPDLDWKWLMKDAAKLGIATKDLRSVGYEIAVQQTQADGTVTNVAIASFENEFLASRTVPVPKEPVALAPVYRAYPTFSFMSGDETMKAYRLQIATTTNAAEVVFDTGVRMLPGRTGYTDGVSVFEVSPEFYWNNNITTNGSFFVNDVSNYYWRVALLNSKFNDAALESDWSKWSGFQMDVGNANRYPDMPTGYGKVGAVVRYFGPARTNELAGAIVVEAFESADFTGMPVDRKRYSDVSRLSDITDISTEDVLLGGIEPGVVYLRAYIDLNNNGRRDAWEPWGYANRVGTDYIDIYTPDGATVTDEILSHETKVIYIEDPDTNRNEIPDCTESVFFSGDVVADTTGADTDEDGLSDEDEGSYGTDASMVDTDGDGMPDGWEVWADMDPLFADADEVADGDVMAFAAIPAKLVTIKSTAPNAEPVTYILKTGDALPTVGDNAAGLELYKSFTYPVVADGEQTDYIGRGGLVTIEAPDGGYENRVVAVDDGTVALVHAQVYAEYGFDSLTANPAAYAAETAVNTKPFTALDKYLMIRYFESLGICTEGEVNSLKLWKNYSLMPYNVDFDEDGMPDGWELYVMFGQNPMDLATFTGGSAISPWNFDDREWDVDEGEGDGLGLVYEYNRGESPTDPWDRTSLYKYLLGKGYLFEGTAEFTDGEVRRFGVSENEYGDDGDNDLVTSFQEIMSYYYDRARLADIDPAKAWSDGSTPDYFRAVGDTYLGALFNGGEFIEPSVRAAMGIGTFAGAGTRDYMMSGWDAWSTARYSILNAEKESDIEGVVNDELMLLIRYWNIIRPGEFTGTTVGEAVTFFHEVWGGVTRLIDDEGNVLVESYRGGVSGPGTIHDADAAQTTTQIVAFFGGQAKMEETISLNKKDLTSDEIVTPEPTVNLMLKYAGNESYNLMLEAYQTSSAYPEYGEQLSAQWTTPVKFDAGVAKVNQLRTPALGTLKQGLARFVAYIDKDGDGKLSAGDTFGEAKVGVGYLGCDVMIRLGDANTAGLPVIALARAAEGGAGEAPAAAEGGAGEAVTAPAAQLIAIVRTKINGQYITEEDGTGYKPRGVLLRKYWNNLGRDLLYPSDFVTSTHIGIDPYLAEDYDENEESLMAIESVTYEIVRIPAHLVSDPDVDGSKINVSNLNHYVWVEEIDLEDGSTSNVTHIVDQDLNEEITLRYSLRRDVPALVSGTANGAGYFSFTVPADGFANTKFWLDIKDADGNPVATEEKGYVLDGLAGGRKVIDDDWLAANGIVFTAGGTYTVRVALGSDKFPDKAAEEEEWSARAEFSVPADAVRSGKLAVNVMHPLTNFTGGITIAAYEKADFANPVVVTNGCAAGEVVEIGGLRPGASYYVAAWYVKDPGDGRESAMERRAYDTWGYLCNLDVTNKTQVARSMAFEPVAVVASSMPVLPVATNTVWLQDTDWNDNGVIDRDEVIRWSFATTPIGDSYETGDLDLDGVSDEDDDDPVFDNGDEVLERDVMAYAPVDFYCVQLGLPDDVDGTNWTWYVVTDPEKEPTADKLDGRLVIPRGTDATELVTLYTTYRYGKKSSKTFGLGRAVADPATELAGLKVMGHEYKSIILMHHQVYEWFGFNPNTANGGIPPAEWVNTKGFTKKDKYFVTNYLAAVGAVVSPESWTNWTLNAKRIDFDFDGIPDGWELYTMFGKNGVSLLDKTAKETVLNAWVAEDRNLDADGDELTNLHEYDGGFDPSDPWKQNSVYRNLLENGYLLSGTPEFTDAEARRFGIREAEIDNDDDNDQISNIQELMAYYYDKARLAGIDAKKAWSDGSTPDYFRRAGDKHLGALFNGGEFIEPSARALLGLGTTPMAGTRDYNDSGWDAWSVARYADSTQLDSTQFGISDISDLTVIVDETGYSDILAEAALGNVVVLRAMQINAGGDVIYSVTYRKTNRIVIPDAKMELTFRYSGNAEREVVVEAYQTSSAYPEYGEQLTAKWVVNAAFAGGIAKEGLNESNRAEGKLRQGPARFVAYIDLDGDGKLSGGDVSGYAKTEVGYLGCNLSITLGEANPALPALSLSDDSGMYSTLALVRSAINGKPLYNNAKGVFIVEFPNNAARETIYPGEYDTGSFIGIDPTLASLENVDEIETVTYEVLRLRADEVEGLSVTNLNNYIAGAAAAADGEEGEGSNVISLSRNGTVTLRYSLARDVAKSIACAGSTADDFTFTFTVPTDTMNTKFWLNIQTNGAEGATLFGGDKGFILNDIRDGVVVLDKDWFKANDVEIPTGLTKFGVILGNDKFGRPSSASCAMAEVFINEGLSLAGRMAVKVVHPTADLDDRLTIAAYEKADLVNPVVVTNGCAAGEVVEIDGLRPGESYYIAAWYVKDAEDGRGSESRRMPYDTWGYLCNLCVTNETQFVTSNAFAAVSVVASSTPLLPVATNTVWLQDTDWNGNGLVDRDEDFRALNGDYVRSVEPIYGFDIEGVDESDLFSDAAENDVFAYAEVPFYCVMAEIDGFETWFAVTDLKAETVSDKVTPGIPVGTPLKDLVTLKATYLYDYGKSNAKRLALGTNVTWTTDAKVVKAVEGKPLIIVHAQVYDYFGFNPNTANGRIDKSEWVNSRAFTSADKTYVTNYLANVLGVADAWQYSLPIDYPDADPVANGRGDGILDGWELYVMFARGTTDEDRAALFANDEVPSPWRYDDREDDHDGDGLDLLHEYDVGYFPTDPWSVDTDHDGVKDYYAFVYHLKGDDAWRDNDGDGLSNYAEYLISEVFNFAKLDPDDPKTDGSVVDSYRRVGELYFGEIFSDHDKVDDEWEQKFAKGDFNGNLYANPGAYDPMVDYDNDGWSNYAEFRAGTDPDVDAISGIDGFTLAEHPVPVVEVNLVYNGAVNLVGSVVFRAWNEGVSGDLTKQPDAVWTVGKTVEQTTTTAYSGETTATDVDISTKYVGLNPREEKTFYLGPGVVQAGSFRLFFKDTGFVWVNEMGIISSIGLVEDANWYYFVVDKDGKLVTLGGDFADETEVGTIDYKTGKVTIDFSSPALNATWLGDPATAEKTDDAGNDNNDVDEYQSIRLGESYVKIEWKSKSVSVNATGRYYLSDCDAGYAGLKEGPATIEAEFVADETSAAEGGGAAGDAAVAKKVFGMVRHVDVGWAGARVEIELNEFSPVTPRLDLLAGTSDRPFTFDEARYMSYPDADFETNVVTETTIGEGRTRVRVVRFALNGYPAWRAGLDDDSVVVFDRYFNSSARTLLYEGDFLDDESFDIDWKRLKSEVLQSNGVKGLLSVDPRNGEKTANLTNMCYLVVIGEGKAYFTDESDDGEITALKYVVERRFESTHTVPTLSVQPTVFYGARPTFTWNMANEDAWAAKYGSSYTAFRLQILDGSNKVVWDSDLRRAPAPDAGGNFSWTAPVCAGGFTAGAKVLETGKAYKWRVSMYNAKFKTDAWSSEGTFTMMANEQQEVNDHGYSSIDVAVKYAGPSTVLSKYNDFSAQAATTGKVHVAAFTSPDFTGDPVAAAIVTNEVGDISLNTPNMRLVGLPANGTYYVRAFIDMNGNGELDEWESWGYAEEPAKLSTSLVRSLVLGLWIEDADTDGDWLPDAWEYAQAGWSGTWYTASGKRGIAATGNGEMVLSEALSAKLASGEFDASISRGLPGASLTAFMDGNFAAALTGLDVSSKSSIEAIRDAVEKQLVPNTLRITSITLDTTGGKVVLGVDADVAESIAGRLISSIYNITPETETANVVVKVYKKATLVQADWELVGAPLPVSIGAGAVSVEVPLDPACDYTSGYYKVEVEQ